MSDNRYRRCIEINAKVRAEGRLSVWLQKFHATMDDASSQYQALLPLEEARVYIVINPHDDMFDDCHAELEISLIGERYETPAEADERWRQTAEYARERDRLEAERKEQAERTELARLRAKYG